MGFIADALDLSRLPPFKLVDVDYEAERAALIAGIKARLTAAGIPYDVDGIETDPFVYFAEEVAYRKTVDLQRLNDAGKRLILPFAFGVALDLVAATYFADLRIARLPLVASPRLYALHPEDWEDDDRFRRRIALAPKARTPGTLEGYEYFALTAAPHLLDALALNYASGVPGIGPGQVEVVLFGIAAPTADEVARYGAGVDEASQVALAAAALRGRETKLGTDDVSVRVVARRSGHVEAVLYIPPGPSPAVVVSAAAAALAAYQADVNRIAAPATCNNIRAALTVGGVRDVALLSPTANIDPGLLGVVAFDAPVITTQVLGG